MKPNVDGVLRVDIANLNTPFPPSVFRKNIPQRPLGPHTKIRQNSERRKRGLQTPEPRSQDRYQETPTIHYQVTYLMVG